jgi:hypothetical protein
MPERQASTLDLLMRFLPCVAPRIVIEAALPENAATLLQAHSAYERYGD